MENDKNPINIAYDRDRFAADRTILAWIRTSLALIGFGFSIFEFFQFLRGLEGMGEQLTVNNPRNLGLILVSLGVIFLMLATLEYIIFVKKLSAIANKPFYFSISLCASFLLSLIGFLTLVHMLVKLNIF